MNKQDTHMHTPWLAGWLAGWLVGWLSCWEVGGFLACLVASGLASPLASLCFLCLACYLIPSFLPIFRSCSVCTTHGLIQPVNLAGTGVLVKRFLISDHIAFFPFARCRDWFASSASSWPSGEIIVLYSSFASCGANSGLGNIDLSKLCNVLP